MSPVLVHATAVALGDDAVLLRGASGAGKSDLALRLMALDGRTLARLQRPKTGSEDTTALLQLVSDDQVLITAIGGDLYVSAPEPIRGLLEVRGVGILSVPYQDRARLRLVVDLVAPPDVPRLPSEADAVDVIGVAVPRVHLHAFDASAPLKCALALRAAVCAAPRS